jgi:hypothetical protein
MSYTHLATRRASSTCQNARLRSLHCERSERTVITLCEHTAFQLIPSLQKSRASNSDLGALGTCVSNDGSSRDVMTGGVSRGQFTRNMRVGDAEWLMRPNWSEAASSSAGAIGIYTAYLPALVGACTSLYKSDKPTSRQEHKLCRFFDKWRKKKNSEGRVGGLVAVRFESEMDQYHLTYWSGDGVVQFGWTWSPLCPEKLVDTSCFISPD